MDAGDLKFPDASFDTVVAMYVMTVVPEPENVMRELARVTKPGGEVMLVNHFSQDEGVRGWVERRMAPFADKIGWRPVFDVSRVMVCDDLELVERKSLRPLGLFTMMRFAKTNAAARRGGGVSRPNPVQALAARPVASAPPSATLTVSERAPYRPSLVAG